MSEKIYACLVRLFPSSFRTLYEEEGLRLLSDRLRDERGFFGRLRLSFDLIVDMVGALPQAYRNSYAEAAAVVSVTPHFDGIPSFQSLQNEPIRRGTFVVAGFLTLAVLVTFGYVMELPIPYPAVQTNGRNSPIESVIARLNTPTSYYSTENIRSETTQALPTAGSRPENRITSTTNPAPSSPVPGGPPFVQSQAEAVPAGVPSVRPANARALVAVATSLSGNWSESLRADGGDVNIPNLFIFDQHSAVLSGTGGPDFTDQYPIVHGSVAGNSVRFELNHKRKRFLYDLKFEGEELRGTLSIRSANETRTTAVRLERTH